MCKAEIQYPYIVADVGGTNARFALVSGKNEQDGRFLISHQRTYPSIEFEAIEDVVRFYINSLNGIEIQGACLAVAGPVVNDQINLTNLNWNFSIDALTRTLNLSELEVINDFAAYAFATSHLSPEHFITLNKGEAIATSPIAVVGPGTGFGVAALAPQNGYFNILPTEGGHMTLAANTPLQADIIATLNKEFEHVSIEKVLSGPGIMNLYRGLAKVEGIDAPLLSTAEIVQHALNTTSGNTLCQRTLALFTAWLGSITGDLALSLGARGGVFLGGGILPRIIDFLLASDFMQQFMDKGPMKEYLHHTPVHLVTEGNSALLGAASWFESRSSQHE